MSSFNTMPKSKTSSFSEAHVMALGAWHCDQVTCTYAPLGRDARVPTCAYVDNLWESHKIRYPSAFDGPLLGLVEVNNQTTKELPLLVKRTSYAQYIATREPSFEIECPGVERANPIGMTIVLLSADDKVVVTHRSAAVDQNAGRPYFVGGYVEPPAHQNLSGVICANAAREIEEELGMKSLAVIIIGMARDPFYCHPELFAVSRVPVRAVDIPEVWRSARDRHEASQLSLLPISELFANSEQVLFPAGVTWSFSAATSLLKRSWRRVEPLLSW